MQDAMTNRQRIHAAIHRQEVDRFPVWLKMANATWRTAQPAAVRALDDVALLRAAGCDVMVDNALRCAVRRPHVREEIRTSDGVRTQVWETPDATLTAEWRRDPYTNSWHPTKFPATSREELAALRWVFRDTHYTVAPSDAEAVAARQQAAERSGHFTIGGVGPGPLMDLVEHQCGPEHATFLSFDEPDLFAEVLTLMHADRIRWYQAILPHWRADTLWMTENTSTTLISPGMFREFCMPHLRACGQMVLDAGIIPVHHMCGTLNALLEDIDALPALANEAFTTRPLGDVSLAEGRRRMPSKCLIGGTNATLWMSDPETILATVAEDLDACDDRRGVFLTSAGVLPAGVGLEKARQVAEGLKALPT